MRSTPLSARMCCEGQVGGDATAPPPVRLLFICLMNSSEFSSLQAGVWGQEDQSHCLGAQALRGVGGVREGIPGALPKCPGVRRSGRPSAPALTSFQVLRLAVCRGASEPLEADFQRICNRQGETLLRPHTGVGPAGAALDTGGQPRDAPCHRSGKWSPGEREVS